MSDFDMILYGRAVSEHASGANSRAMTRCGPRTKSVRVLIVTGQSEGGIWHYVCSLASALASTGVQVALAVPLPFEPIEIVNGIPIWSLGTHTQSATRRRGYALRRVRSHVDKIKQFRRAIISFRPDIVHLHDRFGLADFVYFKFLRTLGVRIVYTAHDVTSLFGKRTHWFDRARYRQAD